MTAGLAALLKVVFDFHRQVQGQGHKKDRDSDQNAVEPDNAWRI